MTIEYGAHVCTSSEGLLLAPFLQACAHGMHSALWSSCRSVRSKPKRNAQVRLPTHKRRPALSTQLSGPPAQKLYWSRLFELIPWLGESWQSRMYLTLIFDARSLILFSICLPSSYVSSRASYFLLAGEP